MIGIQNWRINFETGSPGMRKKAWPINVEEEDTGAEMILISALARQLQATNKNGEDGSGYTYVHTFMRKQRRDDIIDEEVLYRWAWKMEDAGIEANTYSWSIWYGQNVMPVHYTGI